MESLKGRFYHPRPMMAQRGVIALGLQSAAVRRLRPTLTETYASSRAGTEGLSYRNVWRKLFKTSLGSIAES